YLKRTGRQSAQQMLDLMIPVCSGVAAAHAKGIIHRDIKPGNIFLAKDKGGKVTPKVLDFGLARLTEGDSITRTQAVVSRAEYMAPEQCKGLRDLDARVDVYALGSIAYRMLTGVLPISGHSTNEIFLRKGTGEPPAHIKHVLPGLDDGVASVVMRSITVRRE